MRASFPWYVASGTEGPGACVDADVGEDGDAQDASAATTSADPAKTHHRRGERDPLRVFMAVESSRGLAPKVGPFAIHIGTL